MIYSPKNKIALLIAILNIETIFISFYFILPEGFRQSKKKKQKR